MKVLVVGSGGREHALGWKIAESGRLEHLFFAPGNAGTARLGRNIPLAADDLEGLLKFAREEAIDLTIVGPEAPLVGGIADLFVREGLALFGPSRMAARLEGSKAFAKEFMQRHRIPTARHLTFSDPDEVRRTLSRLPFGFPLVLKADGLAAGKGVFICSDAEAAREAIEAIMVERRFGSAGSRLVLEEFLAGQEASFMVLCDGERILPLAPARDYKAIGEGGRGPNTGGMGAFSAEEILSAQVRREILERIIRPTIEGMGSEGVPYRGVLYAGLMLTDSGPRVLEFNVRFGDPETQVVLPRLESDLLELLEAAAAGRLPGRPARWSPEATVCVVLASGGYPGPYATGVEIQGVEMAEEDPHTVVFHAGTALCGEKLLTRGGRVLGVTSRGPDLQGAALRAYEAVHKIHFEGVYYRRDIASGEEEGELSP